jgi:hypothetical protein
MSDHYCRNCPKCGKIIEHKNKSALNDAERKKRTCVECAKIAQIGRPCHSDEYKKKLSTKFSGENNPMFGKQFTDQHRQRLSISRIGQKNPNYGKHCSEETKKKISAANTGRPKSKEAIEKQAMALRGRVGPNAGRKFSEEFRKKMSEAHKNGNYCRGGGSGWSGWYKGWYFRSISELRYVVEAERSGMKWEGAETGSWCIRYKHPDGSFRIYHPDLLVGNSLVEIKPKYFHNHVVVKAKQMAAINFCKERSLVYKMVDAVPLDMRELEHLYDSKEVIFTSKSLGLFLKKRGSSYVKKVCS